MYINVKNVNKCLKEPHYVDFNLCIIKLSMSFIVMDLLGEYPEMENGNCFTMSCKHCPHQKKTDTVITAYIKYI